MPDHTTSNARRQVGVLAVLGIGSRVASQSMTLILLLLAGRFLSVEIFGMFVLGSILMNLADMQMYSGIYHYVMKEPEFKSSRNSAFSLQVLYGLVFSILIFLAAWITHLANWGDFLALLIASTAMMPLVAMIASWQEAKVLRDGDVKYYYTCLLISEICGFVVGVAMLLYGYGVWSLIANKYIAALIVSVALTLKAGLPPKFGWDEKHVRSIIDYCLALYGSSFLTFVSAYGAAIVLGGFLSAKAVGLFRMGSRTAGAALDVFAQTFRVLAWQAVGRMAREKRLSPELWTRMVALNLSIMSFALGSMSILAEPLTKVLLGDEWLPMVPVLQVICLVNVLASVDQIGAAQLAAVGETRFLFRARVIQVITLLASLLVTVQFGIVAVAIGLFPPAIVYLVLLLRKLVRHTETDFKTFGAAVAPGLLVSGCALLVVYILSVLLIQESALISIPVIAAIGLAVYIGIAFLPLRSWTLASLHMVSTAVLPRQTESASDA